MIEWKYDMLKIRLSRIGKKHQGLYKIIVKQVRSGRDGKYLAQIGNWNPKSGSLVANREIYRTWLEKGALPTPIVYKLFQQEDARLT